MTPLTAMFIPIYQIGASLKVTSSMRLSSLNEILLLHCILPHDTKVMIIQLSA